VKSFPVRQSKQLRPHAHGAVARISWARLLIMAFDRRQAVGLEIARMVLDACYRNFVIARYETEKKLVRQSQCRRDDEQKKVTRSSNNFYSAKFGCLVNMDAMKR
jgi:hypothetical protein